MKRFVVYVFAFGGLLLATGIVSALSNASLVTITEHGARAGVEVICESTTQVAQCNPGTRATRETSKSVTFQCRAANAADTEKLVGKEAELTYTSQRSVPEACA